jgi:hypothetical protein
MKRIERDGEGIKISFSNYCVSKDRYTVMAVNVI